MKSKVSYCGQQRKILFDVIGVKPLGQQLAMSCVTFPYTVRGTLLRCVRELKGANPRMGLDLLTMTTFVSRVWLHTDAQGKGPSDLGYGPLVQLMS